MGKAFNRWEIQEGESEATDASCKTATEQQHACACAKASSATKHPSSTFATTECASSTTTETAAPTTTATTARSNFPTHRMASALGTVEDRKCAKTGTIARARRETIRFATCEIWAFATYAKRGVFKSNSSTVI